jgi:hypothetical protein
MDWITVITSIGGAAAAAWIAARLSVKHAQKLFSTENSKAETIKAIELSEMYVNDIMPLIHYFSFFYKANSNLEKYRKTIEDRRKLGDLEFSESEMRDLFSTNEVRSILEEIRPEKIQPNTFSSAERGINLKLNLDRGMPLNFFSEPMNPQAYMDNYSARIPMLLNRLEYFSMYFNAEIADKDVVYQSLHQTYIAIITFLYFNISKINENPKDKYFTNTIRLYNDWSKKYNQKKAAETEIHKQKELIVTEEPVSYKERKRLELML